MIQVKIQIVLFSHQTPFKVSTTHICYLVFREVHLMMAYSCFITYLFLSLMLSGYIGHLKDYLAIILPNLFVQIMTFHFANTYKF